MERKPIKLAERCSSQFESQDWRRGAEYYSSGSVVIQKRGRSRIEAEVDGNRGTPYQVILDWAHAGNGAVDVSCDCPRYDDGFLCKHIAAAIREVDAIGLGATIPGPRRLRMESVDDGDLSIEQDDDVEPLDFEIGPPGFAARAREILSEVLGIDKKPASNLSWSRPKDTTPQPTPPPLWKQQLDELRNLQSRQSAQTADAGATAKKQRQLWFRLDLVESSKRGPPFIAFHQRMVKSGGTAGKLTPAKIRRNETQIVDTAGDRELVGMLLGCPLAAPVYGYYGSSYSYRTDEYVGAEVEPALLETVLTRLAASGRLGMAMSNHPPVLDLQPLTWDDGPAWQFQLSACTSQDRKHGDVRGWLVRGEERRPLSESLLALQAGIVVFPGIIARYDAHGVTGWPELLRRMGEPKVPIKQAADLAAHLRETPRSAIAELPEALDFQERTAPPTPHLTIKPFPAPRRRSELICNLSFRYGDCEAAESDSSVGQWNETERTMLRCGACRVTPVATPRRSLGVRL